MDYVGFLDSQVFRDSRCLEREAWFVETIRSLLRFNGFQSHRPGVPRSELVMHRDTQQVVLSIVDDISSFNPSDVPNFLGTFGARDVIVTDNYFHDTTPARVVTLPRTWFGIYHHRPDTSGPSPDRAFSMPINRVDIPRALLFLEMHLRGYLGQGYVNFNCGGNSSREIIVETARTRWRDTVSRMQDLPQSPLKTLARDITDSMPYRNHDLDHDRACASGVIHVVAETYTQDHSVALSEKTFRALCQPRPWMLFGGPGSVAHLQRLGFDVMDDVIDHSAYDHEKWHSRSRTRGKITTFVETLGGYIPRALASWPQWQHRAHTAAQHNQQLLARYSQRFPQDIPGFLAQLTEAVIS